MTTYQPHGRRVSQRWRRKAPDIYHIHEQLYSVNSKLAEIRKKLHAMAADGREHRIRLGRDGGQIHEQNDENERLKELVSASWAFRKLAPSWCASPNVDYVPDKSLLFHRTSLCGKSGRPVDYPVAFFIYTLLKFSSALHAIGLQPGRFVREILLLPSVTTLRAVIKLRKAQVGEVLNGYLQKSWKDV
jgi:hypothetical protein